MKRLYLMRHGHSPTTHEAGVKTDALRPPSDKGREDAVRVARELARRGAKPGLVLHSPLARAMQTAVAAAAALDLSPAVLQALDNTLPADEAFAGLQQRAAAVEEVLAVGHQPQVGEITAFLTDEAFEFRPAGLAAIELGPSPRLLWAFNADELA
ncbi:MAG: histidine phosphatase family protein [Elusimicrobia bacterium]|nr:histidine phosphatase family protein [Elusimicrobiota bacterium]